MPRRSRLVSPAKKKPGLVQIAAELGVSPATVSRALRRETAHMVKEELRKEILDLAAKQRFSPNPGARMLRRGVNASLTVVVPFDESIFFSEFYGRFLAGTLHAAAARGWDVLIRTLRHDPGAEFRETMQHIGVDTSGVIYLAEPLSSAEVEQIRGYRRPLVLTKAALPADTDIARLGLPVVGVDNVGGARAAASLLLELGHRKIGLLLGPRDSRDSVERRRGYLEALGGAGVEARPSWSIEGSFTVDGGRSAMEVILSASDQPTAVCCASDEIAFGAIAALQAAGRRCPEDLSIVGFDDGIWATMCRPALTTIRQPLADMAERAVAAIIEAAGSRKSRPTSRSGDFPASLVIRESTGGAGKAVP